MNMTDYRKTSLVQAFDAIQDLATKEGVEIVESEIIGLVPLDAILAGATQYFKLAGFHREQILETKLWERRLRRANSSSPRSLYAPPPLVAQVSRASPDPLLSPVAAGAPACDPP